MRSVVRATVVGAAGGLLIISAAIASNFGSTQPSITTPQNAVSLGNDRYHHIHQAAVTNQTLRASISAVITYLNVGGIVTLHESSPPVDVSALAGNYPDTTFIGWANCPPSATTTGSHPKRTCYGQQVFFNYDWWNVYYSSETFRQWIICHELMHTLGLRHAGGATCLRTPLPPGTPQPAYPYLSQHDKDHLNSEY